MTATLRADTEVPATSIVESRRAVALLSRQVYAPIDEHRTPASNSDIAAAWLAAGMVGLTLLFVLPL